MIRPFPSAGKGEEGAMMRLLRGSALILELCLVYCLLSGVGHVYAANTNAGKPAWSSGEQAAELIGSAACSQCHEGAARSYRQSVHFYKDVDCENCHGVGSLHAEDETKHGYINTFRKETAKNTNEICLLCHYTQTALHGWASGVHSREGVRCVDCHRIHTMKVTSLQPRVRNETCTRCHTRQAAEGNLPYHHPVREAKMTCVDCHNPHGGKGRSNLRASHNDLCFKCHAEKQGPFTYQHAPVTEDCMKCHTPHGSMNKGMLQVSQPFLCLQCHSGHHNGGGIPTLNACTFCHSTIHGTDTPSSTGGSIFIDKSVTAPATLSPLVTRGNTTMRRGTDSFLYAMPFVEALPVAIATAAAPDKTEYSVQMTPRYRYVNTSGYGGRVGEYDNLKSSLGGDLALHVVNRASDMMLDAFGSMLSPQDYNVKGDLRVGKIFSLKVDAQSLVHHLDLTSFGINVNPDVQRDQLIAPRSLFDVRKTSFNADARLSIPETPFTVFVRGGQQSRHGLSELNFFDMAASQTPGVCDTCHQVSRFQRVNYVTRDLVGGLEAKVGLPWAGRATVTYEHALRIAQNKVDAPVDLFGSALSIPGEPLGPGVPPIVPDTPAGLYVHNVVPGNRRTSDTLRLNVQWPHSVTLTGDLTYGSATNTYTDNRQTLLNGDATLNWEATDRLHLGLDYHQQSNVNNFTPFFFTLYGNPDLHQYWAGARADYKLSKLIDVEAYYRYNRVTRSNEDFWPQIYSPHNTDVLLVVSRTTANTLGTAVKLHGGTLWKVRIGYEWVDTQTPGYLTDPGMAHRILVNGSISPVSWLSVNEDVTVTLQSHFSAVSRRNYLYTSTTSLTLKPLSVWSITAGYSFFANDLRTQITFMNDPTVPVLYQQNLVPYYAASHGIVVTSNLDLTKKLRWDVQFRYNVSNSSFTPAPSAAPDALNYFDVAWASHFSRVDVPERATSTAFEYNWGAGFKTGIQGFYAGYWDRVHPELRGSLYGFSVYVSQTFGGSGAAVERTNGGYSPRSTAPTAY